jgi:signal transduction histidine kinase/CheY-like chemotaxis protein
VFALENANWPALLVDASGIIRAASQGAETFFGQVITEHPNLENSIWAKENSQSPEAFFAAYEEAPEKTYDLKLTQADGSIADFRTHVCSLRGENTDLFLLQIFETRPAEPSAPAPAIATKTTEGFTGHTVMDSSLAQKQKLDCAMQLIRTVALDFNNALTSILGHASLLLAKAEQKNPMRSSLVEIEKSAQRAAEVASDLAAFSRQEKDTKAHTSGNVNEVLRRTVEIFKEAQPEAIHWKLDLQNRVYGAKFDEAKMQQAFIKILENAVQAMDGFGTVYISTRNLEIAEPLKDGNARLVPGAYICVEISDTGKGITDEVLPRIFEPFFTTKKEIGHRGLGLAWVYGIVTNHRGSVAVTSEVGKGTSVRVYLPAQKKMAAEQAMDLGDLSGTQTILMIDDEDLLLTMGEMVLSSFGYKVLTANSGAKALEIFAEKAAEIDLVITDLVMPQMSGRELIERLRRHTPGLKVICASGFVRAPASEDQQNYLQKPFASQDLLRKVKQVLSAEERG